MVMGFRKSPSSPVLTNIKDDVDIELVDRYKYLGVVLHNKSQI